MAPVTFHSHHPFIICFLILTLSCNISFLLSIYYLFFLPFKFRTFLSDIFLKANSSSVPKQSNRKNDGSADHRASIGERNRSSMLNNCYYKKKTGKKDHKEAYSLMLNRARS